MKILCVGDSHSRLLGAESSERNFRYGRVCPVEISGFEEAHVLAIKGATAAGFRPTTKKNSSFDAAKNAIESLDPDLVSFGFGQVDAELSCYFVAIRDQVDLDTAIQSRIDQLSHYLLFCQQAAPNRRVLVKGLNTSTLHRKYQLHNMLLETLPNQLGLTQDAFVDWLRQNQINIKRHREINERIAGELQKQAEAAGISYFDIRNHTGLADQPGLTNPEFCGRKRDVHLKRSLEIEACFSELLTRLARETADVSMLGRYA
ncbi:hypothetical protein [uncultured Ruegeria sp.]|uniref:hypothetical protein n=1 Tax=uncultured Ruegeria sp. TaxID=259304 RepID=UPI002613DCC5|nr:hypothetical protein [uncultured Ruegeria sp.]